MAILAWVLGGLGGLCVIAGVLAAIEIVVPAFLGGPALTTWGFCFALAGLSFLAAIAAAVGRSGYE